MRRLVDEEHYPASVDPGHSRFVAFFAATYPAIRRAAYARVNDWQEAEDIAEEVFTAAWRHRGEADAAFTTQWAFGALHNIVGNEYRRRERARRRIERVTSFQLRQTQPAVWEDGMLVRQALARLGEADQHLLRMAYWQDMTREQMATALGCSVGAAKTRVSRAMRALRAALRDLEDGR